VRPTARPRPSPCFGSARLTSPFCAGIACSLYRNDRGRRDPALKRPQAIGKLRVGRTTETVGWNSAHLLRHCIQRYSRRAVRGRLQIRDVLWSFLETNLRFGESYEGPQQKRLAFPSGSRVIAFFHSLGRVVERR
jgi:hypothetical protein